MRHTCLCWQVDIKKHQWILTSYPHCQVRNKWTRPRSMKIFIFDINDKEWKLHFTYICDETEKRSQLNNYFTLISFLANNFLNCWKAIQLIRIQAKQPTVTIQRMVSSKTTLQRRKLETFEIQQQVKNVRLKNIKHKKRDIPSYSRLLNEHWLAEIQLTVYFNLQAKIFREKSTTGETTRRPRTFPVIWTFEWVLDGSNLTGNFQEKSLWKRQDKWNTIEFHTTNQEISRKVWKPKKWFERQASRIIQKRPKWKLFEL